MVFFKVVGGSLKVRLIQEKNMENKKDMKNIKVPSSDSDLGWPKVKNSKLVEASRACQWRCRRGFFRWL